MFTNKALTFSLSLEWKLLYGLTAELRTYSHCSLNQLFTNKKLCSSIVTIQAPISYTELKIKILAEVRLSLKIKVAPYCFLQKGTNSS